jgi:hypothetical protein
MDYPRAFVFINGDEDMPPLASVRKWFGSKMASDVYVQGQSPQDDEIDRAIETMTHIRNYTKSEPKSNQHCVVVSTRQISPLAQQALSERWDTTSWMDSEAHQENLERLSHAISRAEVFNNVFDQLHNHYYVLAQYVRETTGQSMLAEPDLARVFSSRNVVARTEVEAHLRKIAKDETRSGVLWRIDLEDDSTTSQAA